MKDQVVKLIEMVPLTSIKSEYSLKNKDWCIKYYNDFYYQKVENLMGNCQNLASGTVRYSKKDKLIAIKCQVTLISLF